MNEWKIASDRLPVPAALTADVGAAATEDVERAALQPSASREPAMAAPSSLSAAVDDAAAERLPSPRVDTTSITLGGPVAAVLNSRFLVATILLVAGPLGLPALWLSPRFSRVTKALGTLAFLLLTAILPLVGVWYATEVLLRPLADTLQQVNAPSSLP